MRIILLILLLFPFTISADNGADIYRESYLIEDLVEASKLVPAALAVDTYGFKNLDSHGDWLPQLESHFQSRLTKANWEKAILPVVHIRVNTQPSKKLFTRLRKHKIPSTLIFDDQDQNKTRVLYDATGIVVKYLGKILVIVPHSIVASREELVNTNIVFDFCPFLLDSPEETKKTLIWTRDSSYTVKADPWGTFYTNDSLHYSAFCIERHSLSAIKKFGFFNLDSMKTDLEHGLISVLHPAARDKRVDWLTQYNMTQGGNIEIRPNFNIYSPGMPLISNRGELVGVYQSVRKENEKTIVTYNKPHHILEDITTQDRQVHGKATIIVRFRAPITLSAMMELENRFKLKLKQKSYIQQFATFFYLGSKDAIRQTIRDMKNTAIVDMAEIETTSVIHGE